jgi:hypothetical protein
MRPITVSVGPLAGASANNIALSQTPAAGPLTLNGSLVVAGVAILDNPRRILITTTDSTHTFTITGATPTGALLSEVVTGNGTNVQSTLDYKTVTSITINGTASAAVTVGTSGVASTPWARMDEWANTQVTMQFDVVGTVNYTVQSTLDDPNSPTNPVLPSAVNWVSTNDTNVVGATSTLQSNYLFSPTYIRVLLNSSGTTGVVTATIAQANVASR